MHFHKSEREKKTDGIIGEVTSDGKLEPSKYKDMFRAKSRRNKHIQLLGGQKMHPHGVHQVDMNRLPDLVLRKEEKTLDAVKNNGRGMVVNNGYGPDDHWSSSEVDDSTFLPDDVPPTGSSAFKVKPDPKRKRPQFM